MVLDKIYDRPTVRQVIFQITYPSLFYLENRVGDIQEKIMKEFPISKLLLRTGLIVTDIGINQKIEIPSADLEQNVARKIWQFESKNKTILSISSNSLDLTSEFHKTYKLGNDDSKKFKCTIKRAVDAFIDVMKLQTINRIGLRYIDYCPIQAKNNETLEAWYWSKFPLGKFNIADATIMAFRTVVKKGDYCLGYVESLGKDKDGKDVLILDFDGFSTGVENVSDYLDITDKLHDLISDAYTGTIKEPVYKWMEKKEE
ncbi:MAG: TIGR04255 family protein [Methanothrix sp.]|nr:TIGR04255 family protein [Methanothrix sp.]